MDNQSTVYIGLDVHKDSITVARVGAAVTDPVVDVGTIGTQQYAIDRLIGKLSGHGPLLLVYEAGPCGFWLQRYLSGKGQRCVVAAPSLIPRRPGDRIKTDRRDARHLALGLRAGTLTAVHIPTPDQEAFRDVVRAWQQAKRDISKARQRLKAFLLRNDIRYTGRATWSEAHRRWLARLVLPSAAQQIVLQELIDTIGEREARRQRLEAHLEQLAPSWSGRPLAEALLAFRGVQRTVAYTLVAEAGDLARFAHPRRFMAWLGLVPGEHSSGATRRQGGITKTGNRWARTIAGRGRLGLSLHAQGQPHHRAACAAHRPGAARPRLEGAAAPHPQVPAHARSRQATQPNRHGRRPRARRLPVGGRAPRRDPGLINLGGVQRARTGDRVTRGNVMRPGPTRRAFLECGQAR
jgi:transposase